MIAAAIAANPGAAAATVAAFAYAVTGTYNLLYGPDASAAMGTVLAAGSNADGATDVCDDALSDLEAGGVVDESGKIRHVDKTGTDESGSEAFADLANKVGAKPHKSEDGKVDVIELPGGGTASYRPNSNSGPPTVQVDRPGQATTKVRFPRP